MRIQVNTLYIAKKMQLAREMYFAILLDRASAGPLIIACSEGGTSIEDLAESHPEKIIKLPVDVFQGISDAQAAQVVEGLKVSGDKAKAAEQIKALYQVRQSSFLCLLSVPAVVADNLATSHASAWEAASRVRVATYVGVSRRRGQHRQLTRQHIAPHKASTSG
jgi:hypothetical protein